MKSLNSYNTRVTAQIEQADSRQVKNNAGGFSFKVSDWERFDRFLIMGSESSYYASGKKLTMEAAGTTVKLLNTDATEVLRRTVEVSDQGRAKSNSPALFVLALAMNTDGVNKSAVSAALQKVARTSTHLFEYVQYLENLGGWGRAKKNSVAGWYQNKNTDALAMQTVKYRQRNGWTHRDLWRLSHVKGINSSIGEFVLRGNVVDGAPNILVGFDKVQRATNEDEVIRLIKEYNLPWETLPTQWHKSLKVWRTIFEAGMGQTALLRNVTRFAKLGAFDDMVFAKEYASKLGDAQAIEKGRMHPINYLNASVVYSEGQMDRGKSTWGYGSRTKAWGSNSKIQSALDTGFELAFKNIEPANKRTLVALDVSGSMGSPAMGLDLSCAQVAAAVGMFVAKTEPYSLIKGFSHKFVDIDIKENDSFATVVQKIDRITMGGTDCSLPMVWAEEAGVGVDTFVVITDSETWAGRIHPHQALKSYRNKFVPDAKLAVLGVEGNDFTVADREDKGQMDFCGFDSSAPRLLSDFSAGRI